MNNGYYVIKKERKRGIIWSFNWLKQVRKGLRNKGYKESKSRTNRYIGTMHLSFITEYFIKGNLVFEIERDLTQSVITTQLHYNGKEHKEIKLADVLSLA